MLKPNNRVVSFLALFSNLFIIYLAFKIYQTFNKSNETTETDGILIVIVVYLIIRFVGTLTGLNKRELEISQSHDEVYFKKLFENSLQMVYIIDRKGYIECINPAVTDILGYTQEQSVGAHVGDIFLGNNFNFESFGHAHKGECIIQEKVLDKWGIIRDIEALCIPIKDEYGNIIRFIGVSKDITNEKAYSKEIELLGKKYKSLFTHNSHFVARIDNEGIIAEINDKTMDIFGEEIVGKHFGEILYHKEKSNSFNLFMEIQSGNVIEENELLKNRQGEPIHIEYKSIPMIIDNQIEGTFVIGKDITEKERLQTESKKDLELAKVLQNSVLSDPIITSQVSISGEYVPASDIGGDMYTWYQIDENRIGVMILDVMGHGVSSALISMSIRSVLQNYIISLQTPSLVMERLNKHFIQLFNHNLDMMRFFTAIYFVLDLEKKEIEYVNAGHPPGIVLKKDGTSVLLNSTCLPIGMMEDFTSKSLVLSTEEASNIILFTDGLLDYVDHSSIHGAVLKVTNRFMKERQLNCTDFIDSILKQDGPSEQDDVSILKVDIY